MLLASPVRCSACRSIRTSRPKRSPRSWRRPVTSLNTDGADVRTMRPVDGVSRPYQICVRCVMDTSDPEITFDDHGVCNHCLGFVELAARSWHPDEEGGRLLG